MSNPILKLDYPLGWGSRRCWRDLEWAEQMKGGRKRIYFKCGAVNQGLAAVVDEQQQGASKVHQLLYRRFPMEKVKVRTTIGGRRIARGVGDGGHFGLYPPWFGVARDRRHHLVRGNRCHGVDPP
ncbi:hypothetical protein [Arthrobacter livingstonensis]|uniref:hypothetical protein n=1 Tax=Arthrobacter livingstonensis TaxID=670078 RepID=UPI001473AC5D|nr:hypothetical protein [Arthrobacter livingstonensis]